MVNICKLSFDWVQFYLLSLDGERYPLSYLLKWYKFHPYNTRFDKHDITLWWDSHYFNQ